MNKDSHIVKEYCFTAEEFIIKINELKDGLITQLIKDSILKKEDTEKLCETYFFTLVKPQYISKFYKPQDGERLNTVLVKVSENLFERKQ
jgi:hypothetical protein